MISHKMIEKSESLIHERENKWVDKLEKMESRSPEEIVQFLSDVLFKVILFLGVPYFLFVFIQFLIK